MRAAKPALLAGDALDGAMVRLVAHTITSGTVAAGSDLLPADEHAHIVVLPGKFELP